MAISGSKTVRRKKEIARASNDARCLSVARRGVKTANDFADYMSALMSDLPDGRVTPQIANAICNAGGKLLKVVEMQARLGSPVKTGTARRLVLTAAVKLQSAARTQ